MTCGRVSPLSTQSTFEDLAVDFEGTTASGAERFYRRTLDKLRLKLPESRLVHTVTLKQTECRKKEQKIAFKACRKKGAESSIVYHKEKITNDFIVNPYAQTLPRR